MDLSTQATEFAANVSALHTLEVAVKLHPADATVWATLGRCRLQLQCFSMALAALRMAVALLPPSDEPGSILNQVKNDIRIATMHASNSQSSGLTILGRGLQLSQLRTTKVTKSRDACNLFMLSTHNMDIKVDADVMQLGTGAVVWEAGVVLAKYLEKIALTSSSHNGSVWKGHCMLELGCGTGIAGLAAGNMAWRYSIVTGSRL